MNMKPALLVTALAAVFGASVLAPHIAQAAGNVVSNSGIDGTINISGQVIAQSCKVDGKAAGTPDNKTVTLPNVLTSNLSTAGAVAGATPFQIVIEGCSNALTAVQTYFSGGTVDASTHNLQIAAGGASNVEVQLLDGQGSNNPIDLTQGQTAQTSTATLSGGSATLNYQARYYATGAATAGPVSTTTNFTLIYQ